MATEAGGELVRGSHPGMIGFYPAALDKFIVMTRADLEATIAEQAAELESLRKDAERWRDLVSHQVFNNKPQVGYAINRAKERVAAPKQEK